MAFADTLGAVGTVLNVPEGAGTTTIESKTNFFGPGVAGTTITAECLPLHRGRRTQTWQTSIRSPRRQAPRPGHPNPDGVRRVT